MSIITTRGHCHFLKSTGDIWGAPSRVPIVALSLVVIMKTEESSPCSSMCVSIPLLIGDLKSQWGQLYLKMDSIRDRSLIIERRVATKWEGGSLTPTKKEGWNLF